MARKHLTVLCFALLLLSLAAAGCGAAKNAAPKPPPESCANQVRDEIRYVESNEGFSAAEYKIPIANCGPSADEGNDLWASAQQVWNNGKIVWWDCRDLAHCVPS